jgi:hypothetical protein
VESVAAHAEQTAAGIGEEAAVNLWKEEKFH